MSLYKRERSPYWWYRFTVDGVPYRGSTKTTDRTEAEAVEKALKRKLLYGPEIEEMRLGIAAKRHWEEHAQHLKSAETVLYQLDNIVKAFGGATKLSQITDATIAGYVARRREEVSPASVNREVALLRSLVRRSRDVHNASVPKEPVWKNHTLEEPDSREYVLTEKQAKDLRDALPDHLRPVFMFSLLTGVRKENAFGLRWEQIDFSSGTISFHVKSRKPGGKYHTLPMTGEVKKLLVEIGPQIKGPVFLYRGKSFKSYRSGWTKAKKAAGVPADFRWHDIRHTTASWLLRRGVPLELVKEILGHQNIRTTMRYAKHARSAVRDSLRVLTFGEGDDEESGEPEHSKAA